MILRRVIKHFRNQGIDRDLFRLFVRGVRRLCRNAGIELECRLG